jgi:hypothetical protein
MYLFILLLYNRSQFPEERPTASEIVDELLDLERTTPIEVIYISYNNKII